MTTQTRQSGKTIKRDYPTDWNTRRRNVYQRDGYACQNCGRRGGRRGNQELHAHHIVPKSKGGTHQESNLITLCKDCHNAIHNRNSLAPTAGSASRWPPALTLRALIVGLLFGLSAIGVVLPAGEIAPSWIGAAGVLSIVALIFLAGLYHLRETSATIVRSIKLSLRNW